MNKKYVHKPTIITAVQWFKHGDMDCVTPYQGLVMKPLSTTHGSLQTRFRPVMVHPGDYILADNSGNMWCISEEDFKANYEGVVGNSAIRFTPASAIFSFAAWLTGRKEPITISSANDCVAVVDLVDEFCKKNNLELSNNQSSEPYQLPTAKAGGL